MIDKSYRRNFAKKITEPVIPLDVLEKKNKEKSWEYMYYEAYDVVVISKDGTIGDIYEIEGLKIAIPATPDPSEIRFSEFPQNDQKWKRFNVPKDLSNFAELYKTKDAEKNLDTMNKLLIKYKKFILEDIERIQKGMWQMIDGEPIWISGGYYFLLQHIYLTNANTYAFFRFTQRDYYYWLEACYADQRSYGSLMLKSRRIFFSTVGGAELIRDAIQTNNALYPILSKEKTDARELFKDYISDAVAKLPIHLTPKIDEKTKGLDFIRFFDRENDRGRNSRIKVYPNTINAYDGRRVKISLNDELGKFKKTDVNIWWRGYHKRCHEVGANIVGKCIAGGTAGTLSEGGQAYETFYKESKINTRGENGRTSTGLYAIFIPADFGLAQFYDEFGYTIYYTPKQPVRNEKGEWVTIGSFDFLNMEERACKSDFFLMLQKINMPRNEDDAFMNYEEMMFDKGRIQANINFINEKAKTPEFLNRVQKYDLIWKDGIPDTEVIHVPSPNGRFLFSWIPPKEYRNKYIVRNGHKKPVNEFMGSLGADTYDVRKVTYGNGSKGAVVGITKPVGEGFPTSTIFMAYLYRPEKEDIFYDDVIKVCRFLSMPILPENNKKGLIKKMVERGYRGYLLTRPDKTPKELSQEEIDFGGMPSSDKTIFLQETAMETYVNTYIDNPESINNAKCLLLPVLEDIKNYLPKNRTTKDLTIATMFAIMANNKIVRQPIREMYNNNVKDYLSIFQTSIHEN